MKTNEDDDCHEAECYLHNTHISFVLEGVIAGWPYTVKVCRALSVKGTVIRLAIFGCTEALEPFLHNGGILPVVVGVHLHI